MPRNATSTASGARLYAQHRVLGIRLILLKCHLQWIENGTDQGPIIAIFIQFSRDSLPIRNDLDVRT